MTEKEQANWVESAMIYLDSTAKTLLEEPYRGLCLAAIEEYATGYGGARHHHAYEGGLAVHVADVVERGVSMSSDNVDMEILLTAAYWHDYEKLSEYVASSDGKHVDVTPYMKNTGHVVGSVITFIGKIGRLPTKLHKAEKIVHCMLAHHGRREWGSPVEPSTPEAWILHACDMMSSREAE